MILKEVSTLELWDAYDKNFKKIPNIVLTRGEVIKDGMYHLVCDIIVKHIDGSYLIMKRDLNKHLGGKWEASAGGSALIGESPYQCAIRELFEETGIKSSNLEELGTIVCDKNKSIYVEFLCITDVNKDSITLQEGETIDYKWISYDELVTNTDLATRRILEYIKK